MINTQQFKNLQISAIVASVAVPLVVIVLLTPGLLPKIDLPFNPHILSGINAVINGLTALTLLTALYFIKNKNIVMHQRLMTVALSLSVVFLLLYVLYHGAVAQEARYGDTDFDGAVSEAEKLAAGNIRYFYLFILLTHIVLSTIVIPFVLFTYIRGLARMDDKHKKLARITFPLWLYVAVTGVLCYIMISPYYPM